VLDWIFGKAVVKRAQIRHLHHLNQFSSCDFPLIDFFFCRERRELLIDHPVYKDFVHSFVVNLTFLVYMASMQVGHAGKSYDVGMHDWHLHKVVVITHVHKSLA
jgi:hypothetical protein